MMIDNWDSRPEAPASALGRGIPKAGIPAEITQQALGSSYVPRTNVGARGPTS